MKKLFTFFVAAIICSGISANAATLESIPYTQNFDNAGYWPAGWSTNNSNVWSFTIYWYGANNPGGYNVYSDYTPSEWGAVFSPGFDGSGKSNIHIKFYHYWKANYPGSTQDGYLYGSNNGGLTYNYLLDEWHHNNPAIEEGEKIYDISSWADGCSDITFKWLVAHNNDYYWQFDNFEIYDTGTPGLWTGVQSTSWNDPGNWDDLNVPTSTVSVTIPSGTPHSPYIGYGVTASCDYLTIKSGATLTHSGGVVSNSHLNVYGDLNSDYGTFTQSGYAYLYFRGNTNTYWDDDNMDDTYRYVRIIKNTSTDQVSLDHHMTIERNLEIVEGTFLFSNDWTLTINSTGSNALEVESGGILQLSNSQTIDVAGDVQFLNGSQANITGGLIRCSGDFRVMENIYFNIQLEDGTVEMDGSALQYIEDHDGNTEFYNLLIQKSSGTCSINYGDLNVNGDLSIAGGTLNPNNYNIYIAGDWSNTAGDAGFDQSTGRVIFNGGAYHQYCSDETFNELEINKAIGGALIINNSNNVVCAAYDWTAGAVGVLSGNFTANDLLDNAIQGGFYLYSGGTINLINTGGYVDLKGDLHISGGTMTVTGSISYWPFLEDASIEMSDGVLDFTSCGITIYNTSYALADNISGGIIKTAGGFSGNRADFTPTAGTFELYGSNDVTISQQNGSTLYKVNINKSSKEGTFIKNNPVKSERSGQLIMSGNKADNNVSLNSDILITDTLTINAGSFDLNGHNANVNGSVLISGELVMNNPADLLSIERGIKWLNGSNANVTAGEITFKWDWEFASGTNAQLGIGNTARVIGLGYYTTSIKNSEPDASFGNLIIDRDPGIGYTFLYGYYVPVYVSGNMNIRPQNQLKTWNTDLTVDGIFDIENTGKVTDCLSASEIIINNDFTLNGLLDVGEGNVLLHGDINIASTGTLDITTGTVIADQAYKGGKAWQYMDGTINMTGGLFEISYNSFDFASSSINNISGGIIRGGAAFRANGSSFNPTGGLVELTVDLDFALILLESGSKFNNLIINSSAGNKTHFTDDLYVKNDIEIQAGELKCESDCSLYVGGNWTDNSGGFIHGWETVIFNGTNDVSITTGETFYNLILDKSSSGDWLTLSDDVTALGDLIVNGGALHTGDNTLDVYGNVNINSPANLFVQAGGTLKVGDNKNLVADLGSSFYIEGSPSDYATLTHSGTGIYFCSIFGEIAANYAIFEFMGLSGVNIVEGATVNSIYTFNNCIFRNGAPAPSALLTLDNDQVFTCNDAYFENTLGYTEYNVWKHFDTGQVTFVGATGDFAGPAYEYDPNERIDWPGFIPGLWTGAVSSDWFTPENWSDYIIPDATIDVTIPSGTPYSPYIVPGVTASCNNLTINSGATLTQEGVAVVGLSHLNVYGNLNSDYGTFTQSGYSYLYFRGSTNTYWDDDNMDDTYRNVRIIKTNSTDEVSLMQSMTIERNLEIVEGTFLFSNDWTLTINSTGSNALEVESGGILQLGNSQIIDVAGDVQFLNGSQANITGGLIRCSGDFRVEANTSYDIHLTGGLVEMFGSLADQYIEDHDGNTEFYNLLIQKSSGTCSINYGDLNVNGDLSIAGGTLNPNSYNIYIAGDWSNTAGDAGFDQSTGRVIFDGGAYHQYCSNETFNELEINKASGGAFRMNGTDVECAAYEWTAGAVDVLSGSFTANDLINPEGILGAYYLNTGGTINLNNPGGSVDLNGELHIFGGTMNIYGGIDNSCWACSADASITMNGGILDFHDQGVWIYPSTFSFTENITGGTIRTSKGLWIDDYFAPTAGTFEFYGSGDYYLYQVDPSCTLYNVIIDKSAKGSSMHSTETSVLDERPGEVLAKDSKSNSIYLESDFVITNDLDITSGSLTLNGYELTVFKDCHVYGILNMTNAADIFNCGTAGVISPLFFHNGSTGNLSAGEINLPYWLLIYNGASFTATTANTINFGTSSTGGMMNNDPNTVFGNINVNMTGGNWCLDYGSSEAFVVNGNFTIYSGNTLYMNNETLIVHGVFTDNVTSQIYLCIVNDSMVKGKGSDLKTVLDEPQESKGGGAKGGYLEIDTDFTLSGLLDVGDGSVKLYQDFNIATSGELTINGGSVIVIGTGWKINQNGILNFTDGLFETILNDLAFTSSSTNNISGGSIRCGVNFFTSGSVFNPTDGEVIMTSSYNGENIYMGSGSAFYNLIIDAPTAHTINYKTDITVNNDFSILDGNFNCEDGDNLFIGGNWTDNSGGFIPNTGTVFFNGTGDVSITPGETFYNLTLDKSSISEWLTLSGNVTALGKLVVNGGALHTGDNTLDVYGNIDINSSANLFVQAGGTLKVGDFSYITAVFGSQFYIEGSPSNYAKLTHSGTGVYSCQIDGEIAASYAIFEYMSPAGLFLLSNATVNPVYSFNHCIFQNGAMSPTSTYLTLNTSGTFTAVDVHFENTTGIMGSNVFKQTEFPGNITFQAATGDFAGPEFEIDYSNRVHWTDIDVDMDLTVMLEGPFNGTGMTTDINGILPGNQPFNSNPLADWYYTGTEYVASMPANVTDWILVELRDASSAAEAMPGDVVAKQAALLLNNGSIVDLDGISNLTFPGITYSSALFPVVWHRNHLGIISSDMMTRTDGVYTYDFTQAGSAYSNTNPGEKLLGGSIWGMLGGDSNGSGLVALGDLSNDWTPYAGETGYRPADYNLDGQLNNKDKNDVWVENLLKLSQIPGSKKTD
jgi:hypothetical protein